MRSAGSEPGATPRMSNLAWLACPCVRAAALCFHVNYMQVASYTYASMMQAGCTACASATFGRCCVPWPSELR